MEIGEILKSWRHAFGLNQRDAGKRLSVHFTYISKIENGILSPSVDLIERMADVYNRSREDCDSACIAKRQLPSWVEPLVLSNPHVLNNLQLSYRRWMSDRSSPPKEYA